MTEKKKRVISLAATLAAAAVIFLTAGNFKRIVFCDEVYTYNIANSEKAVYQLLDGRWQSREEIVDKLAHTDNDSFFQMLNNVKGDSHPPLYYAFVYIASVLSGGSISKWIALSVNGVMFLGTAVMFWLIIIRLFCSPLAASASAVLYALNVSTISDMTLLRMYMQVTFFAAAFAYVTLRLMERPDGIKEYFFLSAVTVGGFMTQYYFSFLAIAFFISWAVYCLIKKHYKSIAKYLFSMMAAVFVSTLLWRHWIRAVFVNSDSEAIKENAMDIGSIVSDWFGGIMTVQVSVFQKGYIAGAVLVPVILILFFVNKKVGGKDNNIKFYAGTLMTAVLLYAGIVYKLTPSYLMSTRYFYVVTMLELLLLAVCVCALLESWGKSAAKIAAGVVFLAADIAVLFGGYGIDYYGDAKEYDAGKGTLEQYADIPWIVCGPETWIIDNSFFDFTIPERLMMITPQTPYRNDAVLEAADEFLIIANDKDMKESDTALYFYIGCTGNFASDELLMTRNGLSVYLAHRKED